MAPPWSLLVLWEDCLDHDKKKTVAVTMEKMDALRVAWACKSVTDLFVKLGRKFKVSPKVARGHFKEYRAACDAGRLANYAPPDYMASHYKAFCATGGQPPYVPIERPRRPEKNKGNLRRTARPSVRPILEQHRA